MFQQLTTRSSTKVRFCFLVRDISLLPEAALTRTYHLITATCTPQQKHTVYPVKNSDISNLVDLGTVDTVVVLKLEGVYL